MLLVTAIPVALLSYLASILVLVTDESLDMVKGALRNIIMVSVFIGFFIVIGKKVAWFISLFVNYKYSIRSHCVGCDRTFMQKELP